MINPEAIENFRDFKAASQFVSDIDADGSNSQFGGATTTTTEIVLPHLRRLPYRAITPAMHLSDVNQAVGCQVSSVFSVTNQVIHGATTGPATRVFETLDAMRNPEERIRRQIQNLELHSPLPYKQHLARRLEFLLDVIREEKDEWHEDSEESLRKMLNYLNSVPSFRAPEVTVTPEMTFRAQWTSGGEAHFAANFRPDGRVTFVVFCQDSRHPEHIQRVAGIAAWESLNDILVSFPIERLTRVAGR